MRRLLVLLVFALAVASCTRGSSEEPTNPSGSVAPTTTVATTPPSTAAPTTVVEEPPGIEELPAELQAEIEALIDQTEQLRGLEFLEPPKINVVTPDELERLVREDIAENTEDIDVDEALYDLLGLIESDVSLLDLYTDVLGEQVAGFYDSEAKEMVVPMRSDTFGPLERSTIVHELTHALTDQHFDFGTTYQRLIDEDRFDEAAAYQAVIEGDAVLTELNFLRGLAPDEQRAVIEESLAIDSSALDAAPRFIQESLIFPYVQGQTFMERLAQLEGQEGLDAAYAEPPVSTEQVITPDDFGDDVPVQVPVPEVELDGYAVEYDSVWGELSFQIMFNQVLGPRPEASDGWGGDAYRVLFDGTDVAMVLVYQGDAAIDAAELETTLLEYLGATLAAEADGQTFTGDDFGHVARDGDQVLLVLASDPEAGAALVQSLTAA